MSNVIYRYEFSVGADDYQLNIMIGHHTAITPNIINLNDYNIVGYKYNCNCDNITGLPTANEFDVLLDIDTFSNKDWFYNATASNNTSLTLSNGKVIPFYFENTLEVKKNGNVIFLGVQERIQQGGTDDKGIFTLRFICILSKALQILEPSTDFLRIPEVALADGRNYIDTSGTTLSYDDVLTTRYIFDFFYLVGSEARGAIIKDIPMTFSSGFCFFYRLVTIKYLFEYISEIISEFATAWRRGTTNLTIDNPYVLYDFYKNSETTANTKGALLSDDDIWVVYDQTDFNLNTIGGMFFESKFNSFWELLRVELEGLPIRSKYNYDTLTIEHYGIIDETDKVTISNEVSFEGNLERNKLLFTEINNQFEGNLNYDGTIGITQNELLDNNIVNKTNNNGNLPRLEIDTIRHNVPSSTTDNRNGRLWSQKTFNPSIIGYLRPIIFSSLTYQTLHRINHVVGFMYNGSNKFEPTPPSINLFYPNASDSKSNGDLVGKNSEKYVNTIIRATTIPRINNNILQTYLQRPSLSMRLRVNEVIDPDLIGSMIEFSNYGFIPSWSSMAVSFGFLTAIEYDFEKTIIEVTLAN